MWREVYEEIDRMIPLDIIEKKWKNIKDTFLKHLKTYKPSGGGVDERKKWKHFECMYFLANVNSNRKTFGNFETVETEVDLSAPSTSKTPDLLTPKTSKIESKTLINSPDITTSRNKRQKKRDQSDQLLMEILQQPAPTSHAAPVISPALMAVQELLKKMPQRIRMEAEIDFLNRFYQLYAEHS
ncbi:unnamed protein product [Phaedon cochleariae]|uniref:MADF domain-containing protein n=1 Tax=Phaedon cochleariae TaxID=80249 RepID=A0A9N9SHJ6_PHACE|nr:unnamed protein product [Phaedon cochleariae]